ncbi:MAG TPA: hypothetical protein VNZ44_08025 [Pyrinomonadaceae bacterium]|nr:hypothetical protein [Pyrinomonadaceae bacterium]
MVFAAGGARRALRPEAFAALYQSTTSTGSPFDTVPSARTAQ